MHKPLQTCVAVALLAMACPAMAAEQPALPGGAPLSPYTLTVIPYYSPEKIWVKFAPFIEYLRKETGHPWELKLYHNHPSLLKGLCSGEVSFALLGPVPLGRAITQCNAGIVAVALGKDGRPYYRSVILTGDPAVRSLEALKGRRFALFKGSTAAHVLPLRMLRDAGLKEGDYTPVFYESQDRIMNALLGREVAGAGVKESLYLKFRNEALLPLKASEALPGFALASGPSVGAAAQKLLAGALIRLDPKTSANDRQLMQDWDDEIRHGFVAPPPDYRASVLNVLSLYREIVHED